MWESARRARLDKISRKVGLTLRINLTTYTTASRRTHQPDINYWCVLRPFETVCITLVLCASGLLLDLH